MILRSFPEQIWLSRPKRIAFVLAAFLMLATFIARPPPAPPPGPALAELTAMPVPLDAGDPARRRVGALDYLGGWALTSDSPRFGSISAMQVSSGRVTALGDAGTIMLFAVPSGAVREPVRLLPLPSGPGPATRKSNRDTESLVLHGPWLWVGFEKHNMIWRYRRSDLRAASAARPPPMRRWLANAGPEAMVRLAGGRFLVFAEGSSGAERTSEAVLFEGDPSDPATRSARLRYVRVPGYRITDAALLPDGRLLLLNRRFALFEGVSAVLSVADLTGLRAGGTIEGREIATLRPPLTVDNMEALSVTVENGRTILWIASDDNFFPLQQTLLLKFALVE
ncbi:MAG: esterase-like activity of phytase family protein [Alphaproteobacteria bacterium]|nr:MAG: esterase-like activity of phytase family protein [Alphaproteobacteria bacterium]